MCPIGEWMDGFEGWLILEKIDKKVDFPDEWKISHRLQSVEG